MEQANSLTYVSNAGIFIKINGKKILIDALNNSQIPIFKSPSPILKQQMVQGIAPFNNIDIFLITHDHDDHFDLESITNFIKYNPSTIIISTNEVISKIKNHSLLLNTDKLINLDPNLHCQESMIVNDISIQAYSMTHDGKEFKDIKNLAYLVEYAGYKLLHIGDASPTEENFASYNLPQKKIDLLIAPFPYIGIPSRRQIIKKFIHPQRIAIVHLPYEELDKFGWIKATKKNYLKVQNNFLQTEFLEEIGTSLDI